MRAIQINPPYDNSPPCAGCNVEARGVNALMHNMFTRWPEAKAFVRLHDLRQTRIPDDDDLAVPHPAMIEMLAVARLLVAAGDGITEEGLQIRWSPKISARIAVLADRAKAALDAVDPVFEAHFHDSRHSSGTPNTMRPRQGSKWAGFVAPDYAAAAYDYTVDKVTVEQPDAITHVVCGTILLPHDHFLQDIRRDPSFFGTVYCPTCKLNAPIDQFGGELLAKRQRT